MLWEYASLAAKYDIYSPLSSTPDSEIKLHIWKSFEKTVVNLLMHVPRFQLLCDLLYCFNFLYVSFLVSGVFLCICNGDVVLCCLTA